MGNTFYIYIFQILNSGYVLLLESEKKLKERKCSPFPAKK